MKAQTRIITSLLDNDFYNFTMGQLIWKYFPGVHVTYKFICRTEGARLGRLIDVDELNSELAAMQQLQLDAGEKDYLRSLGMLSAEYVAFLAGLQLPEVIAHQVGDDLQIEYSGDWDAAIFWETPVLAIVSELATRARGGRNLAAVWAEGERRLDAKLVKLAAHPRVQFSEFGTRRRAGRVWQEHILRRMLATIPNQVLGTSNVALARKFGIMASGTMMHQPFMILTSLKDEAGDLHPIAAAQKQLLDLYEEMYGNFEGGRMLTFLPDTFGTETALVLFEADRAERWRGLRQDSGDPFDRGEVMIAFWEQRGIDPLTRFQTFSDGLDVDLMIQLEECFGDRIRTNFGWGTGATNDVGLAVTSNVIKPAYVTVGERRIPTVKLSDNVAKATGDPVMVERRKAEAHYHTTYNVAAVY